MATSFGSLDTCGPTKRTFKPGVFATKRFTSISGAGTQRLYGSKAFDATLRLSFMLNDSDTCKVLDCWNNARGSYDTVEIPDKFLAGSSPVLDCGVPDYLNWRWAEPPSVESLQPGLSRVQVNLIATLDF